jgi:type IV secretory pathway VirB2 component (pilin)
MFKKIYGKAFTLEARLQSWGIDKKLIVLLALAFAFSPSLFAQSGGASDAFGIGARVQIILDFLSSPWVKGICVIALIVECIGMITAGRQEPGMFKKFVPWIAGTVLFMSAGSITSIFINPDEAGLKDIIK